MASRTAADWRAAAGYDWLLGQDRSAWAWEWLRRETAYRLSATAALTDGGSPSAALSDPAAERWGLHRFEDPRLDARGARPMWTAAVWPLTLRIEARPAAAGFDMTMLARASCLAIGGDGEEHWLVADRGRQLRLDVTGGTLALGPARLWLELGSPAAIETAITALHQLANLWRGGGLQSGVRLTPARAARLMRLLRVADALRARASQREIAAVLFDPSVEAPRWRLERPTVRLQVQRLVRSARALANGGYRRILSGAS